MKKWAYGYCGLSAALLIFLSTNCMAAQMPAAARLGGLGAKKAKQPACKHKEQTEYGSVPGACVEVSTIAVSEFDGKNVSQADASIIADFMRTELINTASFKLVEKANMDKLLAEAAFQQTGCSAADCAVKMGKILNVKYMLVGSLSKLLDTYYITANLVSVETGEIACSFNQEANSAGELKNGCKLLAIKIANNRSPAPASMQDNGGDHNNDDDAAQHEPERAIRRR